MGKVTLKTVAERVGVSPMTVSNAFSRPDQLSAALREKILAAADELGYAGPDPAARTLARGATGTVGILFSHSPQYAFTDEVAASFLATAADGLARNGIALTLLPAVDASDVVPARDIAMDGAIVYSCSPGADGVGWLRRRKLPRVNVDQVGEAGVSSVNVDDRGGARAAAQHLVDLGHRRIAAIGVEEQEAEPGDSYVGQQRLQGWLDVLTPAGIAPIVRGTAISRQEEGAAAARDLLAAPDRPTAVLCFSDALAAGVVQAAQDAGLRVPQDLSVVGFDDSPLAARLRPPLTTVRQDVVAKGRAAAAALVDALAQQRNGEPVDARDVVLPAELVVRDSTAPPPAGGR